MSVKKAMPKPQASFSGTAVLSKKVNSYLRSHDFTKAITILKQNLESSTSDKLMNTAVTDITTV